MRGKPEWHDSNSLIMSVGVNAGAVDGEAHYRLGDPGKTTDGATKGFYCLGRARRVQQPRSDAGCGYRRRGVATMKEKIDGRGFDQPAM